MTEEVESPNWEDHVSSVAMMNLEAQDELIRELVTAREEAGASARSVADKLGISEEHYLSIESGAIDLALSELRQIAFAVGAVITYRVTPNADRRTDLFDEIAEYLEATSPLSPVEDPGALRIA